MMPDAEASLRHKDLLTIEDVAFILSKPLDGVRKSRALGKLPPATPIGNRLYWNGKKFWKWVDDLEEPDDYDYGQKFA